MTNPLFDLPGGRADRDAAITAVLNNTSSSWLHKANIVLTGLAATGAEFTSEDVTEVVGLPPTGSPNAVGALINAARNRGLIVRVGDTQARRRNQHAARLTLWKGAST